MIGPTSETTTILNFLKTSLVEQTRLNFEYASDKIAGFSRGSQARSGPIRRGSRGIETKESNELLTLKIENLGVI